MSIRPVRRIIESKPTVEGAGVKLRRAFGFGATDEFDPFLLFDDFRNERPGDYLAGFPWHPHRGIETITYVLAGSVSHGDSLGNTGTLGPGDVQWMTAGSGIMHQEMPQGDASGRMHGFQLWSNLPAALKMTRPRYQDIAAKDVAEITDDDGTIVRVVVGDFWGKTGPVEGVAADPRYLDVWVPPLQRTAVNSTVTIWPARTCGPVPRTSGCTTSSDGGSTPPGIRTSGAPRSSRRTRANRTLGCPR
jgi:quercetin 2,3-dioxygenase